MEKLDGVCLVPLLKASTHITGRSVVSTQGFQNHSIRSDKRRYTDGSEELYDQVQDSKNFYNLAGMKQYDTVKQDLATWLPMHNAEGYLTFNGQKAMNEK